MIECQVLQNDKMIMHRVFTNQSYSLEQTMKNINNYIVDEDINNLGEVVIRVRFSSNVDFQRVNLIDHKRNFIPRELA